ncbi:baseplate J/gp47 family protein [Clostridium sp. HMP27]|uniref:baseplate J/gp47 family protein n=1 Tax=Clostridium sp. HMP27 TaxID=1487921 RepID=UPI00052CB034|nr:baseplate J/gp47 family protein [Clostridium sp. HMP27]KGK88046.1 hypothetical protein DP68_08960 [Clostridium sp. HMP27]
MYEEQSFEVIMQRMLNRIPDDIDKREGSIIWDALAPEALEFARAYCELDSVLNLVFARTTYGEHLDLICESHGVERKKPECSIGFALVEGVPNFINTAPVEIKVLVKDKVLKFLVVDEDNKAIDLVLPQSGKLKTKLLCTTPGSIGNIPPNTIELSEYIPGVEKVYNTEAFSSGVDEEEDYPLLLRLLEKVKNPPSSGNKNDYARWAKEVPGADYVKVIPLWKGPGTVKLIVFGSKGLPVGQEIINNVKDYIDPRDGLGEGKAPVGAKVTVVTVKIKPVAIELSSLRVRSSYTLDSVKMAIKDNLIKHLEKILPGEVVILKSIEAVIMNTDGVLDFNTLRINENNNNLVTSDEEKVVLQEVKYIE